MVARSRAAARAKTWAASGAPPTPSAAAAYAATADPDTIVGTKQRLLVEEEKDKAPDQKQQRRMQGTGKSSLGDAAGEAAAELVVAGSRKRGRALAARAAERKRRIEEHEREAERELLVRAAEDEAERRVKRWGFFCTGPGSSTCAFPGASVIRSFTLAPYVIRHTSPS